MRIQEVCRKTGLTKKAIYFYIDQGLITPDRNAENNYLDFSEADVGWLQIIALLRQYNVPVGAVEELFRYPSMTNFYLHRQLADLFSDDARAAFRRLRTKRLNYQKDSFLSILSCYNKGKGDDGNETD